MPLGLGSGMFALVLPVEKTNYAQNPSWERGTTGWAAYGPAGSATVGTTSDVQQFGAWSGSISTRSSSGTAGVFGGTFTAANGSAYTVSAYIRAQQASVPFILAVGDSSGNNLVGSVAFTNSGTWQRYSYSFTEASGATRAIVIRKTSDPSGQVNAFFVDGVQIEQGSITTYFDGDDGRGTWQGQVHNSVSVRSGQVRSGGSVVALADLGWQVDQYPGVGMPPIETSMQSYAVLDGAQFQRQRAGARSFSLTASPWHGTSLADFHRLRGVLIDAIKPDAVTPQQPIRFLYVGGMGTMQIDAYYDSGAELGQLDGPIAERAAVKFVAADPYWRAPTSQGTSLSPRQSLGSANSIVWRDQNGRWGTLGANGTTVTITGNTPYVTSILPINSGGTIVLGGVWGTVGGGSVYPAIALYYPATNTFGTLTGGSIIATAAADTEATALVQAPSGSLYVGGAFTSAGGTTARFFAQWNGAWGSFAGGTPSAQVLSLAYSRSGTLVLAGAFTTLNGTVARHVAQYVGGAFGSFAGGTLNGNAQAVAVGLDNSLWATGNFNEAGGTTVRGLAFHRNGAWGTVTNALGTAASPIGYAVAVGPSGDVYAGGLTSLTSNGGMVNAIGRTNSIGWFGLGSGIQRNDDAAQVRELLFDQTNGNLLAGGIFGTAGGIITPDGLARWNGAAWLPTDIVLSGQGSVLALAQTAQGTLFVGGNFSGTASAQSLAQVVNYGKAAAYPTFVFRNTSTTADARLYQLQNITTGDTLFFNLTLQPFAEATLTLTPGSRSFTASQGNVFGGLMPGSNLTSWRLLSGTNTIGFLSNSDSLIVSMYWTPRSWSIDAGTIS